jgi:hypothetical protein
MNRILRPIDKNGNYLDDRKQWLEDNAIVRFYNKLECLEWFVEDDIYQLYQMIDSNMGIDEWYDEMSHRIEEYDETFYILEEETLIEYREKAFE